VKRFVEYSIYTLVGMPLMIVGAAFLIWACIVDQTVTR